jgi:PAS domain S-box-containing protein
MLSLSIAFTTESILYEKLGLEAITSMDDRFRNVFEHSAEGRTMIFPDGTFQVNKAFGDMLGYTISELNALTWIPVTHPEDQKISKENMELLIQNRAESVRFDKRYLHKNGQTVWVDFQSYLQRDKDGNPLYFINSASDITATKDLQEQLIQARDQAERANKLKDAFIANMSHEIRTPLNAILGFSDLLHDEISQKGLLEYESYFDIIQSSGIRLMRTVDMILNISRLQVGAYIQHPVRLSLSKMIADLVNEYRLPATKKGLTIEFHSRVNEPEILADEYCILHSISNLIDNAIKYTRSGSIHLTLYHSENQLICLEVKDTGIGIAEEYMTQIFNPFTQEETSSTRNFEGIGLGLSLAYRMLGVTGSTLSVKSLKGQGTTFTITFPRTATLS